jgi:hypothetical protein
MIASPTVTKALTPTRGRSEFAGDQARVHSHWRRITCGLILFGVAFGYVEAAVVVYLRAIHEPVRERVHPGTSPAEVFPLLTFDELRTAAPEQAKLVRVEVVREAATLLMLAGVALAAVDRRVWLPAFAVAFGVWDIFYYVFLRLLIGWPASLFTWDVLFLIPAPWAAPVLAPVIVSLSVVVAGIIALRHSVRLKRWHWAGIGSGAVAILLSFLWDSPNVLAGGFPHPFFCGLFVAGEVAGFGSFLIALRNNGSRRGLEL